MLDYIIQVFLFQTFFLVIYDLLLKRETFFQWNRVYLILTSLLAYLIPFLKFDTVQKIIPQEYVVQLPEVILSPTASIEQNLEEPSLLFNVFYIIFCIGIGLASILFLLKLYRILRLISGNEKINKQKYWLVFLENNSAFSFFSYIFLNKTISEETEQQIIEHELVHVQQKHSLDLLLFEIQRIMFWFNPFSYIYQYRISELHEFIADSRSIKEKDSTLYFNNLLSQTFNATNISFINPFFKHSLLKKRIMMLRKNRSKQLLKFKYLLLLPLLMGMLIYTSCENNSDDFDLTKKNEKRLVSIFMGDGDKVKKAEIKSKKKGYFDLYAFEAIPEGKEITYDDLSSEEKLEYDNFESIFSRVGKDNISYKIYEDKKGKRALLQKIKWKGINKKNYSDVEQIPFAILDQSPIFPGCENNKHSKKCLQEKIKEFVNLNYDISITKSLGLNSGKKRVYVQFTINKNGSITDIRARGPHKVVEKEAIRVIKLLPVMQPGEQNGKKVNVKYTLPIAFMVE